MAASIGTSAYVLRNKFNQQQKHKLFGDGFMTFYCVTKNEALIDALLLKAASLISPSPTPNGSYYSHTR